jgi:protein-S-isoprenylcysteine O-methyltransferase Ste14
VSAAPACRQKARAEVSMRRTIPTLDGVLLLLAPVLGGGAQLLPLAWSLIRVDLGLSDGPALALDAALSLAFFAQHSGMVRRGFKAALARRMPERYLGAVYAIASGAAFTAVLVLWQKTEAGLGAPGAGLRLVGLGASALALTGFAWAVVSLRRFDPFGLRPILAHLRGRPARPAPFSARGAYRWVRHPLYLCVIVLLWAPLDLGLDRLLGALLWTAWIVAGAALEERDLVAALGEPYRAYQQSVPMLLPWRRPAAQPERVQR